MEELGLPGIVLMENAGYSVVEEIAKEYPKFGTQILVIAGGGNNGGDGYVIARRLIDLGFDTNLCLAVDETKLKGDAKVHFDVYKNRKLPYFEVSYGLDYLNEKLEESTIVVDALLGTGVSGEVRSPFYEIIELMNASRKDIIAVDVPSGVNANTGEVANIAVRATKTITFAMPKIGFFLKQGPEYIGELVVKDISVPEIAVEQLGLDVLLPRLLDRDVALCGVPPRPCNGHKGTFGHVLVIGGCSFYVGAPQYSSKAAFSAGAGLVTIAVPEEIYPVIAGNCPECLMLPLPSNDGFFAKDALNTVDLSKFDVVAIGPGMGRNLDGTDLLRALFSRLSGQTVIVDADGLFFFKELLDEKLDGASDIIATPHPGEMATLTGLTVAEIESDRIGIAKDFAKKHKLFVLLKGHRPVIATPDGEIWINPFGNDALGKGGSGDVLTGLIASFIAQGSSSLNALLSASYFHAYGAEQAGMDISNYGVSPMDIIEYVRGHL